MIRKIILKKLKGIIPSLQENDLELAITKGCLTLSNVIFAPQSFQQFLFHISAEKCIIQLKLNLKAKVIVSLNAVKIRITSNNNNNKEINSKTSSSSTLPFSLYLNISDLSIDFLNQLDLNLQCLNCQLIDDQIQGNLYQIMINHKLFSLTIYNTEWNIIQKQDIGSINIKRILINQTKIKIGKFNDINVKLDKNIYGIPLLEIIIQYGMCYWYANIFYEIIQEIKQLIKILPQQQQQQVSQKQNQSFNSQEFMAISILATKVKLYCMNQSIIIGKLIGNDVKTQITLREYIVDIFIEGNNLAYNECSNYPHSQINKQGFQMIVAETLKIPIKIYDDNAPIQMINNNVYNFVEIIVINGQLQYIQQPFLRFFDWLIEQFIALIIKDYGVTQLPLEIIEEKLISHRFTSIELHLHNVLVTIKPLTIYQNALFAKCQQFHLHTEIQQCFNRSNQMIWETLLCMQILDLQLYDDINPISSEFDLDLVVKKCGFSQLYIFKGLDLDKTFKIQINIKDIQLFITKQIYMIIMKILFNNILYDDNLDSYYLYQINKPTPIRLELSIEQIKLNVEEEFQFIISPICLQFQRNLQGTEIQFQIDRFQILHKNNQIIKNKQDSRLEYKQQNNITGEKKIQITIKDILSNFNLEWLFSAINFFMLDDTIQLICPSDYKKLNPLSLELVIENIFAQLIDDQNSQFQIKGNLFFVFLKNQSPEIHQIYHKQEPIYEDNTPSSCMKIESSNLSLYQQNWQVFQPISVQWKSYNFQCWCNSTHQFLNESNLNIENLKLFLTLQQLKQLTSVINYLIKSMFNANQYGDIWNEQYQLVSQSQKQFNIEHLEIWLMGSKKCSLVPLINTNLCTTPLILHQSYQKMLLSGNIRIEVSYFNPLIGIIEPLIEKFSFDIILIRNKVQNPNFHLQIEAAKDSKFSQLNLILHQSFINLINDLIHQNKKKQIKKQQQQEQQQQQIIESPQNENIILFKIRNQSGYNLTITIEDQNHILQDGQESDFITQLKEMDFWRKYNRLSVEFITLNKKLIKLNKIEQNSKQIFKINGQQHFMYFNTCIKKLIRIISINGFVNLLNNTNFEQLLEIINSDKITIWSKQIKINERITLPSELMYEQFFIRISNSQCYSQTLVNTKSLLSSDFTFVELQQGNQFITLQVDEQSQQFKLFKIVPSCIVNNLLPYNLDFKIQNQYNIDNQIIVQIPPNEKIHIYDFSFKTKIIYLLKLNNFSSQQLTQYNDSQINLKDLNNDLIYILHQYQNEQGQIQLFFYPKKCIINTTQQQLCYYSQFPQGKIKLSQFDTNYTFLCQEKNLILCYEENFSQQLSIKAIGDTNVEIKVRNGEFFELFEFGINISLLELTPQIYTTIIEIVPMYVIINQTENILQIQQQDTYCTPFSIEPNNRICFNWNDSRKEKIVAIKLMKITGWSQGLYLQDMRTLHFIVSDIFIQCTIVKKKGTFFVTFAKEQAPYQIINKCNNYRIRYAQEQQEKKEIFYNEIHNYSWMFPQLKPQLIFYISYQQDHCEINLDLFKSDSQYSQQFGQYIIYFNIFIQDNQKIITLCENQEQNMNIINKLSIVYINLSLVTFSIIVNYIKTIEMNLITLDNVEIGIQQINNNTQYQFKIKFINIDNNYSYETINQVLLTPQQFLIYLKKENCALDIKWAKNNQLFEYFFAYIAPFEIKLDQEYLSIFMTIFKQLKFENNNDPQFQISKYLFNQQNQIHINNHNPFYEWLIIQIPHTSENVYIKQLILPVLKIRFSFQTYYNSQNNNKIINVIANSLDFAWKNIDNAPIILKGIKMENIFDTQQGLQTLIKEHYRYALLQSLLPILGSVEILGNPTSFLNHITTGVVDLIEKPIEAISQGPLEMGLGILEGASSLVRNTFAGAFYSMNKLTGSIGNQISLLSFDEAYIEERRRFMSRRPTQVFEGVYFGIQALLMGLGNGVVGFFQHPYQQGRKDGAAGILRGSTIGIAGVVIKPLTSIFDAASKTAEGMTNTATYFDDHPNSLRMRNIRAFYEHTRYIKSYNENDSYFMKQLNNSKCILIDTFLLQDLLLKKEMHLVITQIAVFYMNKEEGIKWQIRAEQIKKIRIYEGQEGGMRLQIEGENEQIIRKLKFKRVPYSGQIIEKLNNMIE